MKRSFVKADYKVTSWDLLQPYFVELKNRSITSAEELEKWLKDYSELGAIVSEDMAWRYIKMTCDTSSALLREQYNDFVQNIEPNMAPIANELNIKIMGTPFKDQLTKTGYAIYLRSVKNSIDLFREENIPLNTQLQELEQQFGEINGAQSIEYNNEKMTLQKASVFLKDLDRSVRHDVYTRVQSRRAEDESALNDLFTKLIGLRHQVALNAGFKNFRDYKHQALGRFDYSVEDCLNFHEAVKQHAAPLLNDHDLRRKNKIKL
jgi:oligoendopeptidase F